MKKYLLLLVVLFASLSLAAVDSAESAPWVGIPPWEIQRDIAITKSLTLSNRQPQVGGMVSAEFSLRNNGTVPYTFQRLGVAARGPQCYNLACAHVVDFPFNGQLILQPGQSFTYKQQRAFYTSGDYFAQLAYQAPGGAWYSLHNGVNLTVNGNTNAHQPAPTHNTHNSGGAPVENGAQSVSPIKLETTTHRVNDVYYASFTLHNAAPYPVTYQQIGVAVRGPNCGPALNCNAIKDFPFAKHVTIPAHGNYTFKAWQQLTQAGRYTMQAATLTAAQRWEFLGAKTAFTVQPALNAPRHTRFQMAAHYHPRWNDSDLQHLQLAKATGIDLLRVAVAWNYLQPDNGGSYDSWYSDRLAEFLQRAQAQGINVYLMVSGTPCWASADPHKKCQWKQYNAAYPPANSYDYANMLRELVRRHRYEVTAWEIWNEPNISRFWVNPDPIAYTHLLQAASQAIKSQHPHATVLGGALAGTDFDFLMGMYSRGAHRYYDALSIHPYANGAPNDCTISLASFYCGVEGIRAMMGHHDDHKPVWFTEFGWSSLRVGEYNQAHYLEGAIGRIKQWDFVAVATWYNLLDNTTYHQNPTFEHYMGLYRANGQPKPAAIWLKTNPQ